MFKILLVLGLFVPPSYSQISDEDKAQLDSLTIRVKELENGRPTVTGQPQFLNGIKFADGTVQVSSPTFASAYVQIVSSLTVARYTDVGGSVPYDDTPPQISEGFQVLVATITPKSASSNLEVYAYLNITESTNNCNDGVMCLFTGATASAVACVGFKDDSITWT